MALKLLQPGTQPIGQYDGYDNEITLLKGGEVVTLTAVALSGTDKAAYDSFDGYVNDGVLPSEKRIVVTKNLDLARTRLGDTVGCVSLFMLADEGISGYGTLLGSMVGETVGQSVSGTVLGPHTTAGSGKVTCWDKPGLYAVSLDACDTNASTGLQPTNTTLQAGDYLYATDAGLLTPNGDSSFDGTDNSPVGTFVSFETNGSLVNTPNKLAQALNSPSGSPAPSKSFKYAVFFFNPKAGFHTTP